MSNARPTSQRDMPDHGPLLAGGNLAVTDKRPIGDLRDCNYIFRAQTTVYSYGHGLHMRRVLRGIGGMDARDAKSAFRPAQRKFTLDVLIFMKNEWVVLGIRVPDPNSVELRRRAA